MVDLDFGDIFKTLRQFFDNILSRKEKREQRSTTLDSPDFLGFRAPLKGALHNSGGFDPTGKGNVGRIHQGVDLRAPGGTSVYPIAPGVVKQVYDDPKGGNAVVVDHKNGYSSYYAHLGTVAVHAGENVGYDTVIGTCGASGNAKGFPHVHLQTWRNGALIDPASVFSIPRYTAFDSQKEKLWMPGAKEVADTWSMQSHLGNKNKRMV